MSVNAKLEAAEAHFGQDAATLSMVLNLRQRKVMLIKLRTGQWMTAERGEPRMSFSKQVVQDSMEAGLLRTEGVDKDGPSLLGLTYEGDKLAGEVLAWLKAQNEPSVAIIAKPGDQDNLKGFHPTISPKDLARLSHHYRDVTLPVNIIKEVVEQIGDESLVGASYSFDELRDQLVAGFGRAGMDFIAMSGDEQADLLEEARQRLEEEWGLVQTPEDE